MALQSLQLRFCLDEFRLSQNLWRSEDTRRRPTHGPLYGNEFALRGSMGKGPRHIVRVACLIQANMRQRVTRVPEVYEHEAAFCHAFSPTRSSFSLESGLPPHDPFELLSSAGLHDEAGVSFFSGPRRRDMTRHHFAPLQ